MSQLCSFVISRHTEYEEFVVDATFKGIRGHFLPNKVVFSFYSYMNNIVPIMIFVHCIGEPWGLKVICK